MVANDSRLIIKDLSGIADCKLTGTEETINKGKQIKNIRLAYCGLVPLRGLRGQRHTATADACSKSRTPPWEACRPSVHRVPRRRCSQCDDIWQPNIEEDPCEHG